MNQKIIATDDSIEDIVLQEIVRLGIKADLNHIDVSQVTDMSGLFGPYNVQTENDYLVRLFNGDISQWDVSNVANMEGMFESSDFQGDISKWNVSKVENMKNMFHESEFNGDISKWDVSNVKHMPSMFSHSKFNGDLSTWSIDGLDDEYEYDHQWTMPGQSALDHALDNCPAAQSERFGQFHFACKAVSEENSNPDFGQPAIALHPDAEAAWNEHAPFAKAMGLEGAELGKAVHNSYQASIGQAQPMDDLVDMDFTMPTEDNKQQQVSTSNDLAY